MSLGKLSDRKYGTIDTATMIRIQSCCFRVCVQIYLRRLFSIQCGRSLGCRADATSRWTPGVAILVFCVKMPQDFRRLLGAGNLAAASRKRLRSEEHTSELQSQSNLVCRLLLEKKKNHI